VKIMCRTVIIVLASIALCSPAVAGDGDLQNVLAAKDVASVRINLNPWGPHLGFELEIEGDDPALPALLSVIVAPRASSSPTMAPYSDGGQSSPCPRGQRIRTPVKSS